MANKCFMCGSAISKGILCEKCDKPRRTKATKPAETTPLQAPAKTAVAEAPPPSRSAPPEPPSQRMSDSTPAAFSQGSAAHAVHLDPFPKAPVVQFPLESTSLGITSVVDLLIAAAMPAVLVGVDRGVKFVSEPARKLFELAANETLDLKTIESKCAIRIGELSVATSAGTRIANQSLLCSLVPLSGGAAGAVLVFRAADGLPEAHASFVTYIQETVLGPLRSLRESLAAADQSGRAIGPLLSDSASTIDQILSSLELAPGVDIKAPQPRQMPTVTDVVHRTIERFQAFAELKNVRLQADVQELQERFVDHEQLGEALGILMDNALHYVPAGGEVVAGVRWMEHKGKPLFLFFVMDTGPLVPENLRQIIFEPDFVWNPSSNERTGRSLFKAREFAVAHSGSLWVDSRTGKACTFFLRVRPDGT